MIILLAIAAVAFILGIVFLRCANCLDRISKTMNKVIINTKEVSFKHDKYVGVFLILFALYLFFVALKLKH